MILATRIDISPAHVRVLDEVILYVNIYSVLLKQVSATFDDLSMLYRNHPLHVLDEQLFNESGEEMCELNNFGSVNLPNEVSEESDEDELSPQNIQNDGPQLIFDDLPSRQRKWKVKKLSLLSQLKHLTELCHNIKASKQGVIEEVTSLVDEG